MGGMALRDGSFLLDGDLAIDLPEWSPTTGDLVCSAEVVATAGDLVEAVGDDWLGEVVGDRHQRVRVANDDALTTRFDEAIRLEAADDSTHRIQRRPGHLRDVLS